jgi:anaerobic selenocysteine-containing dehydrogenase
MSVVRKSFCRNCGATCGVEFEIEDNVPVTLRGDRENPVSRGYFCIKGMASLERQQGRGRLPGSQKRAGDRFEPIAMASALDEIAAKLKDLVSRHGPSSVGLWFGTGAFSSSLAISVGKGFANSLGTPQIYTTQTIDQSPKAITALRMGAFKSGKQNIAGSDVWLLSAVNPIASHQGGWGSHTMYAPGAALRAEKRRGLKLIVIDPRLTETARLADIHLRPKPGQDVAVNAALLNVILSEGLHDPAFCDRYVENLDRLRGAVARYTPEYAEAESGVPADELRAAARLFGGARRGATSSGTGSNMAPFANLADHLLECLNVVCGRYRRTGEPIVNPSILSAGAVSEGVYPPYPIWDHSPKMASHPEAGWACPTEYPANLLADEIRHPDGLKALIVVAGNPLMAIPDHAAVKAAFEEIELLVTLDVRMSETAQMSDYVLACKTPYERADLALMTDGNSPFPAAQYTEPVFEAPGDAIEEWRVLHGLARRMGFPITWEFSNYGSAPTGRQMVLGLEDEPHSDELFDFICNHPSVPFERLKANAASVGLAPADIEPAVVLAADPADPSRLDVLPDELQAELDDCFASHQRQQLSDGQLLLHSRRLLEALNSNYLDSEVIGRRHPVNTLRIHPDDLAARGLRDGDGVEVDSGHGMLSTLAEADPTQRLGTVSMHHAWGAGPDNVPVSVLIDKDAMQEAHNFVPRMSAIPVTVRRAA